MRPTRWLITTLSAALVVAACGDDDPDAAADDGTASVVVTTNILGEVVSSLLGDAVEVTTIMPVGANPHDFQASAQHAAAMRDADLLVVNGGGFEEGLLDVVEGAGNDGVPVYEALSAVEPLGDEDDHLDQDEHTGEDEHGHSGVDPHFFTDPSRVAAAAQGILDAVVEAVPALDTAEVRATAAAYLDELSALDSDVESILSTVPPAARVLVTDHEVFSYFAERYGFEVVGTVIPGGSTNEGVSADDLAALVDVIAEHRVRAIFADTSGPARLADTLAAEVGDVEVVELFSESLGDEGSGGETYLDMMRTNAERIANALA